jgi:hypothetical protein
MIMNLLTCSIVASIVGANFHCGGVDQKATPRHPALHSFPVFFYFFSFSTGFVIVKSVLVHPAVFEIFVIGGVFDSIVKDRARGRVFVARVLSKESSFFFFTQGPLAFGLAFFFVCRVWSLLVFTWVLLFLLWVLLLLFFLLGRGDGRCLALGNNRAISQSQREIDSGFGSIGITPIGRIPSMNLLDKRTGSFLRSGNVEKVVNQTQQNPNGLSFRLALECLAARHRRRTRRRRRRRARGRRTRNYGANPRQVAKFVSFQVGIEETAEESAKNASLGYPSCLSVKMPALLHSEVRKSHKLVLLDFKILFWQVFHYLDEIVEEMFVKQGDKFASLHKGIDHLVAVDGVSLFACLGQVGRDKLHKLREGSWGRDSALVTCHDSAMTRCHFTESLDHIFILQKR